MGYINPIIKYGLNQFMSECKHSGVDRVVLPDIPPEEADKYVESAKKNEISPILLVAPNTKDKRIREISRLAETLIYCVAILGVTGGKGAEGIELKKYLKRVEENCECPFVAGFGIKEGVDVIEINKLAHGAVVGTAIIEKLKNSNEPVKTIREYIQELIK
jgi:tryptophan synthase alpha chain